MLAPYMTVKVDEFNTSRKKPPALHYGNLSKLKEKKAGGVEEKPEEKGRKKQKKD